MSLVEDRDTASTTSTSEIRRGNDDQWWWMAFVTAIAMVALAMSIVSFALYATKDSGGGGGDSAAAPAAPAAALTISAKEFAFSPKTVTAKAGTDVAITLNNTGAVEHEWTVLKAGTKISKEADFNESMVALKVGPAAGGASATGTANLEAGVYQVVCTIKGHFDAGMAGTLTVS